MHDIYNMMHVAKLLSMFDLTDGDKWDGPDSILGLATISSSRADEDKIKCGWTFHERWSGQIRWWLEASDLFLCIVMKENIKSDNDQIEISNDDRIDLLWWSDKNQMEIIWSKMRSDGNYLIKDEIRWRSEASDPRPLWSPPHVRWEERRWS